MKSPSVSIVILTKNAGPEFRDTLSGVTQQDWDGDIETLVLDSGSTDETLAITREFPEVTIRTIEPGEFDHGHTRNLGVLHTRGELLVFLTQDAVPADARWLSALAGSVASDDRVAGAYSRVLPQPDATFLVRNGVERDINARGEDILQGPVDP